MRKQYDDFTQLKLKDMSKTISDMIYKYINPDTQTPTIVPAGHYENILNQITEKYMEEVTSRQFLSVMYNQLSSLKKEDEKYFYQALLCIDMGINPKDLRINEQIALTYTNEYIGEKQQEEKKNFHLLSEDIVETYEQLKNDPEFQSKIIRESDRLERQENQMFRNRNYDSRDER